KWVYFLKSANKLSSVPPTMEKIPALNKAFKVARESKLTKREIEVLEKQAMFMHDGQNAILYAEQKGMEKGRKEAAIEIAREFLDVLDAETISKKTGLSLADIQALT
ncbi:MAG: transposase, partial [Phormidesmis sp. CAN_BIN44]|nr:transposase [Phormidesmis sp. CAN_BIN44]